MKNDVNIHQVLRVFNKVVSKGEKTEQGYEWQGFVASSDFDGYTCVLSSKTVSITLLFHNKYQLDFSREEDLEPFFKQISALDIAVTDK
jgi:hypothetical protein